MFSTIVVGTDGSPTAAEAVSRAIQLAKAFRARLHLVTGFHPRAGTPIAGLGGDILPDSAALLEAEERTRASVREVLERAAAEARAEGVATESHAVVADGPDAIIAVAEKEGADLIVVGSKGMTGARRLLLGSVPNKVSHHCPCHLLIVKTA